MKWPPFHMRLSPHWLIRLTSIVLVLTAISPAYSAPPNPVSKKLAELITFEAKLEPTRVKPGELVKLTIIGTLREGYHTYPLTQRAPEQSTGQLAKLQIKGDGLKPLWPIVESKPEFKKEADGDVLLEHLGTVTWTQEVLVLADTMPGQKNLTIKIKLMVCDEKGCIGPGDYPPLQAHIEVDGAAVAISTNLQARVQEAQPPINIVSPSSSPTGVAVLPQSQAEPPKEPSAQLTNSTAPAPSQRSLGGLLLTAMLSALGMLLTPCVFPMIPITVSFFVKQAEREHNKPLTTAAVYSLTIIVVLALAVLVLGKLIITWANDPWLNLFLGLVLTYFALSLFGMYEIELPSGLARFTSAHEGQGGYAGAFFMALTFTITSFTCTGPFLGPLLVTVKEFQLHLTELVLAAFAYSATFAAPFFVLALFPTALKKLPKSGNWMNNVKVVMGFLELVAALKFLGTTDIAWHPGKPWLFNYETVLCAWIALSIACGFYLLGLFRLPHDIPEEHLGVGRLVLATIFLGIALYMTPALWRRTPQGILGEGLVAFLPLDTRPVTPGGGKGSGEQLAWHLDYQRAWEEARRDRKLILIDFTGVNCTNCRANEQNVFVLPEVERELAKYVRVKLYTDTVPDPTFSASEAKLQAEKHLGWQNDTFHNITQPFYAVIKPSASQPIDNGKFSGSEIGRYDQGLIRNPRDFEDFLRKPMIGQVASNNAGG